MYIFPENHLNAHNSLTNRDIETKFDTDKFYVNTNHSAKFFPDRSIMGYSSHIRSTSENHLNAHNSLINEDIGRKFDTNKFYVYINHCAKCFPDRFIMVHSCPKRSTSANHLNAQNSLINRDMETKFGKLAIL